MAENTQDTTYTDEQIASMRAAVAAADAKKAEEMAAKRRAYLQPVEDLVASDAFKSVLASVTSLQSSYQADDMLSVHVNALVEIMPRLAAMAELARDMSAPATAPETLAQPAQPA